MTNNNNNKWEEFHANNKSLKVYKQYEKIENVQQK